MKPTKMRNRQIYYADMKTGSARMSCQLSKDLRKKYGKKHVRVVEGDSVKVIRGEFTGVDGKVTEVSAANNGLTIEGVKKEKLKGGKFDVLIHSSNVIITSLNTDDKWRVRILENKPKPSIGEFFIVNPSGKGLYILAYRLFCRNILMSKYICNCFISHTSLTDI